MKKQAVGKWVRPVTMYWLSRQPEVCRDAKNRNLFSLESQDKRATIEFFEHDHHIPVDIVELIAYHKSNNEIAYYLHFELRNYRESFRNLRDFLAYIRQDKVAENMAGKTYTVRRVAICCSSGWTSSFFASHLQEYLDKNNAGIQVTSGSYNKMEAMVAENDLVFMAPQIAYLYPALRQEYGEKIVLMDTREYATQDYESMVRRLIH